MNIIFDLDQTLVDSSLAEDQRKRRDWSAVYSLIPKFTLYEGMREVLDTIAHNNINVCIVTTSPGAYAKRVLNHFGIQHNHLIDYFAVSQRKPHPESFHQAVKLLRCDCSAVYSFGDRAIDIQAAKAANVKGVACTWGTDELELLKQSNPDYTISDPKQILEILNLEMYERPLAF